MNPTAFAASEPRTAALPALIFTHPAPNRRQKGVSSSVMDHLDTKSLLWMFGLIQAAGIVTAWLARVSEGSRVQPYCQRLFLASLLLTGVATMAAPQLGGNYWLMSATTLGVMVLFAVCDFRQPDRAFTSHGA